MILEIVSLENLFNSFTAALFQRILNKAISFQLCDQFLMWDGRLFAALCNSSKVFNIFNELLKFFYG